MIPKKLFKKLSDNWGYPAETLECDAVMRIYDPQSRWQCWILAINPDDINQIYCIIDGETVECCEWTFRELWQAYGADGEPPSVDVEFRPIQAKILYKKLLERGKYD